MATKTNGNGAGAHIEALERAYSATAAELAKLRAGRVDVSRMGAEAERQNKMMALERTLQAIAEDLQDARQAALAEEQAALSEARTAEYERAAGALRAALAALVAELPRLEELAGAVNTATGAVLRAGGFSWVEVGAATALQQGADRARMTLQTTAQGRALLGLAPDPTGAQLALSEARDAVKRAEQRLSDMKALQIGPHNEQGRDNAIRSACYAQLGARRRLAQLEGRKAEDADWTDEQQEQWIRKQMQGGTWVGRSDKEMREADAYQKELRLHGADVVFSESYQEQKAKREATG